MKLVMRMLLLGVIIAGFFGPSLLNSSEEADASRRETAAPAQPAEHLPQSIQGTSPNPAPMPPSSKRGRFLETVYDLGRVTPYSGTLVAQFAAVNESNTRIRILRMIPDCGCARTEYVASPIEPMHAAVCSVHFDPSGKLGKVEVGVLAAFDDDPDRPVQLRIRCDVVDVVTITPRSLDLGAFSDELGAAATVEVRNMSDESVMVQLHESPDQLNITFPDGPVAPPNASIRLQVSVPPESGLTEAIDGVIRLGIGEEQLSANFTVKGAPGSSAIEAIPSRIGLGFVSSIARTPQRTLLRLESRDGLPFLIDRFECDDWDVDANLPAEPELSFTVHLAFTPRVSAFQPGPITSELITHVVVGGERRTVRTPVRAFIDKPAQTGGN